MSVASQATTRPRPAEWRPPTRLSSVLFAAKTAAFQFRRAFADLTGGVKRHRFADDPAFEIAAAQSVTAQSVTALWSDENFAERALQLGKVQNLRRAVRALDGVVIPAGQTFSFWKQVGRATVARGFVKGRMLREGCMVPAPGGGLCQLSNALYDVALQAGCEVVERHAHSRIVPGSAAAYGRDATVAWNYVDLRFRPREALRLETRLDRDSLVVRLLGRSAAPAPEPTPDPGPVSEADAARSCASCDETDCFLHEHGARARQPVVGRGAFLVDEAWPEFQAYVAQAHAPGDVLGLPIDGTRLGLARYRFPTGGYARVGDAALAGALRALAIRRAPKQGPARRRAELDGAERVALSLARLLSAEVTEVVVAQSLLPALWRAGHLGGRGFSVLMTRLPMTVLQARLDAALAAHPDRRTLGDFRAPLALARAEAEALSHADRIITPHADIAAVFGDRAVLLDWSMPPARPAARHPARRIAFPGPTVARKGAHAVRDAARTMDLEVVLCGSESEGAGFWDGLPVSRPDGDWLEGVGAVVQPAIVEEQPRRLLEALAAGVPVIASAACGLAPRPGLTLVAPDDPGALAEALAAVLP